MIISLDAIHSIRNFIDRHVVAGSTVNLHVCAVDLSKAFDKVNHHAMFIKLMKDIIRDISYMSIYWNCWKIYSPVVTVM